MYAWFHRPILKPNSSWRSSITWRTRPQQSKNSGALYNSDPGSWYFCAYGCALVCELQHTCRGGGTSSTIAPTRTTPMYLWAVSMNFWRSFALNNGSARFFAAACLLILSAFARCCLNRRKRAWRDSAPAPKKKKMRPSEERVVACCS